MSQPFSTVEWYDGIVTQDDTVNQKIELQNNLINSKQKLISNHIVSVKKIKMSYREQIGLVKKSGGDFSGLQAELKAKLKNVRADFKSEKINLKNELNKVIADKEQEYKKLVVLQSSDKTTNLKREYKNAIQKLKADYKISKSQTHSAAELAKNKAEYLAALRDLENKMLLCKKGISKKLFLWSFIAVPIAALVAFLVAFLYYDEQVPGSHFDLTKSSFIVALVLILLIIVIGLAFTYFFLKIAGKIICDEKSKSYGKAITVGFVCDFLDTIGIGSFAPSIAMLRSFKQIDDDKKMPGTLNVGHSLPEMLEAVIFFAAINMDPTTLVVLIVCSVVGAYLGAFIANKVSTMWMKFVIGICLLIMVIFLILGQPYNWEYISHLGSKDWNADHHINSGAPLDQLAGTANGLTGWKLAVGAIAYVILGFLVSFGIGLYAPAMAVVSLLGIGATYVYPIMAGASAFLMPIGASSKFIADKNYLAKTSAGISVGGAVGVMAAFLIVFVGIQIGGHVQKEVFMYWLKWLVIVVIIYTIVMMFLDFAKAFQKHKTSLSSRKIPSPNLS